MLMKPHIVRELGHWTCWDGNENEGIGETPAEAYREMFLSQLRRSFENAYLPKPSIVRRIANAIARRVF